MRCDALGAFANALREFANALAFELRKRPLPAAAALPAACSHQPAAAGHYAARFRPHIYKCALCPFLCPKRPISQTTGDVHTALLYAHSRSKSDPAMYIAGSFKSCYVYGYVHTGFLYTHSRITSAIPGPPVTMR